MLRLVTSLFEWQVRRRARRRRNETLVLIGIALICIFCFAMTCVCGMVDYTLREVGVLPTRTPTPPWPLKPVRPNDARVSPSGGFSLDDSTELCIIVTTTRGRAVAARRAHNPEVGGSNPPPATKVTARL